VELVDGDAASLREAIRRMARRLTSGELMHQPLPPFPSETDWADEVCRHCGWLKSAGRRRVQMQSMSLTTSG
jgi:hypothetical protein